MSDIEANFMAQICRDKMPASPLDALPTTLRVLSIALTSTLLFSGCLPQNWEGNGGAIEMAPTPTLFGTAVTTPIGSTPTSTPEPASSRQVCVFPVDVDDSGVFSESALYRLQWPPGDNLLTAETRDGNLNLRAPVNIVAGARRLLIVHRGDMPEDLEIPAALKPNGAILFDPGSGATEIRDPDNSIHSQTIHDPRGDINAMKPSLDIITVERQIADEGGFIIRLTTDEADDGEYAWSFENVELLLGQERYARRILKNGKVVNLHYDSTGNYSMWAGTLIAQANTLTWALNSGVELPFGARTATSQARADSTTIFPVKIMQKLWQAALTSCS